MFQELPYQKLSGYRYDVEDYEPYPCLPSPVPDPMAQLEVAPDLEASGRSKRSFIYEPPDQKNDVYSIFKVPKRSRRFVGKGNARF